MRVRYHFFKRLANVEDKAYQYQNDSFIEQLSVSEKQIVRAMTEDLRAVLYLKEEEVERIYIELKKLLLQAIRKGHCEIPWLDIELLWKDHDGIFGKLHALPMNEFKNYIDKMSDIIKTIDKQVIGHWIEF